VDRYAVIGPTVSLLSVASAVGAQWPVVTKRGRGSHFRTGVHDREADDAPADAATVESAFVPPSADVDASGT